MVVFKMNINQIGRQIVSYKSNESPSIQTNEFGTRPAADLIEYHAGQRIQFFLMSAVAYWRVACNLPVEFSVKGARIQTGRGSGGNHATHPHTAAGLTDNIRDLIIQDVIKNGINSNTKRVLKTRGITKKQITKLAGKSTGKKVSLWFDRHWKKGSSFLSNTEVGFTVNATTNELRGTLNLLCDGKMIEGELRPKIIPNLYKDIATGATSPLSSTTKYAKNIKKTLKKSIKSLNERIELLNEIISNINKYNILSVKNKTKSINKIRSHQKTLTKFKNGVVKSKLPVLIKFIKKKKDKISKKSLELIKNEIKKQIEAYQDLVYYAKNELNGTLVPPPGLLFGEPYDSDKLSPIQKRLLRSFDSKSSPTPLRKRKKPRQLTF